MVRPTTAADAKRAWGQQLADARRAADITQVDLAARLGVDQTAISRAELGKAGLDTMLAIAAALDFDMLRMAS